MFICNKASECGQGRCYHKEPHERVYDCDGECPRFTNAMCVEFPRVETPSTYWICYIKGTKDVRNHRHPTLQSAKKEAERLARLTGKKTHVYEWKGACQVNLPPVTWDMP